MDNSLSLATKNGMGSNRGSFKSMIFLSIVVSYIVHVFMCSFILDFVQIWIFNK